MKKEIEYIDGILKFSKKSSLENTREMLRRLGNPCINRKMVHVAGTNGKGSVCAYMDGILRTAGYRTALFTSPHLVRINERMRVDGIEITDEEFEAVFCRVKKVSVEMAEQGFVHPSYFEFLFGMAMCFFNEKKPDYIVLETGLGGRLDATNAIDTAEVTVITSIGLDHTEILGTTYAQIAYEKAGIIKSGVPVVYDARRSEVSEVIEKAAKNKNAVLYPINASNITNVLKRGKCVDFLLHNRYYCNEYFQVHSEGLYQTDNAALAVTAVNVLGITDVDVIRQGLLKTSWTGRMQEIQNGVIIDGAHNDDGITSFIESVRNDECNGNRYMVFSAVKDKHYAGMIQRLSESRLFKHFYVAPIEGARCLETELIQQEFEHNGIHEVTKCDTSRCAFDKALSVKQEEDRVYIAGSLYLAGEILSQICS